MSTSASRAASAFFARSASTRDASSVSFFSMASLWSALGPAPTVVWPSSVSEPAISARRGSIRERMAATINRCRLAMAIVSGGGARAKRRDIRPLGTEDGHAAVARLPPGGRHLVCALLRRAVRVEVREAHPPAFGVVAVSDRFDGGDDGGRRQVSARAHCCQTPGDNRGDEQQQRGEGELDGCGRPLWVFVEPGRT